MQRWEDDHTRLRAELAELRSERRRLDTMPSSLAEREVFSTRLADFYERLETHFRRIDSRQEQPSGTHHPGENVP
jgi:hypothetical protein